MTKSQQLPKRSNHLRLVTVSTSDAQTAPLVGELSSEVVHQLEVASNKNVVVESALVEAAPEIDLPEIVDDPDAQYELAKKQVLRRLTGSGQTRHQLEQYLLTKDTPQAIMDQVLDRFSELGLLNDQEFADTWVRNRRSTRKSGPAVLRRELQERGVDSQAIAAAVESREGEDYDFARELALKRLPSLMRYEPQARIRRLANFLVRRGYNPGLAFSVVKELFAEAETVLEDPDFSQNF